jgi:hypothetical protein
MRHRIAGGIRQLRELLPAEARYPAPAKVGQADILRRHAGAPRPDEFSEALGGCPRAKYADSHARQHLIRGSRGLGLSGPSCSGPPTTIGDEPIGNPRRRSCATSSSAGTGLRVSELWLGAMTFGEDWGWGALKVECARILEAYAESGGNFVDIANFYTNGTSERIVGELIAHERDHWVLATKYALNVWPDDPNAGGSHRKNLTQALEASLKHLSHRLHRHLLGPRVGRVYTGRGRRPRARRCGQRRQGALRRDLGHAGVARVAGGHARGPGRKDALCRTPGSLQPGLAGRRAPPVADGPGSRPCGDNLGRIWLGPAQRTLRKRSCPTRGQPDRHHRVGRPDADRRNLAIADANR